jgi:hypothetical protein
MNKTEYQELKRNAKTAYNALNGPIRASLVKAAYRVSKRLFNDQERLIGFWEAILTTAPTCQAKGWSK